MENPFLRLHKEFRMAGADVLLSLSGYAREFARVRRAWRQEGTSLMRQHDQLVAAARQFLEPFT